MIAAANFVMQFVLPNLVVLILAGILDDTNSAVTWSVVGGLFNSSLWPSLLCTDSVASRRVPMSVRLFSWLRPLALILVAIAAIVTPLGLSASISPAKRPRPVPFTYLRDTGPMGVGTLPRTNLSFSRGCLVRDGKCIHAPHDDRKPLFQVVLPIRMLPFLAFSISNTGGTLGKAMIIMAQPRINLTQLIIMSWAFTVK